MTETLRFQNGGDTLIVHTYSGMSEAYNKV
jgi:hypothetical protein